MVNKAHVGRGGDQMIAVAFEDGDTIGTLLDNAEIFLSEGEEIKDENTHIVEKTDTPVAEGTYYIVKNLKNA